MTEMLTIPDLEKSAQFTNHRKALQANTLKYLEYAATQGDFLRIPLPLNSIYFVNHPDLVAEVFLKQSRSFQKPLQLKYTAKQFFGENVFTTDGDLWTTLRGAIQPGFSRDRLYDYSQLMVKQTELVMKTWQTGTVLDMAEAMMDLTLRTTTLCFFGVNLSNTEMGKGLVEFIQLFFYRLQSIPLPGWIPIPSNRRLKQLVDNGRGYFLSLIEQRRQSGENHGDVLSMLVEAQRNDETGLLTDIQICNEVSNLFAAGYEVTAYSLAFTLYLLATHPQIEQRLRAQLQHYDPQDLCDPSKQDQFAYLEQVIQEAMRLYPVAPLLPRQSMTPVNLQGYSLPAKSFVIIAPWTLHRRADIYEDPLSFNPDRFSGEHVYPKFSYIAFSGGPRACIGQGFAMMQMKINLAMILKQYRLSLLPDYQFQPTFQFNLRPENGLPMKLEAAI